MGAGFLYAARVKTAIILLSGGLDSATVAAMAGAQGFSRVALSFDYGQRHRSELEAARRVAAQLKVEEHRVLSLDMRAIGGSALTSDLEVPKEGVKMGAIPVTYVPARNTIFLSLALGLAEVVGARDIFFGANAVDYSGYPDCRPAFVEAFEALANVATKVGVEGERIRVHAPLMSLTKCEIIQRGLALGVDYALTESCYDPVGGLACGSCDACRLRRQGFLDANEPDPTRYRQS